MGRLGRTRSAAPLLAGLLALAALSGCGGPEGDPPPVPNIPVTTGPAATPSESPTSDATDEPTTGAPESTVIALLSDTAVGGSVDTAPILLEDEEAVDEFVADLTRRAFAREVRAAVDEAQVPEGHVRIGAVVAIGCDIPAGVELTTVGGELQVVANEPEGPETECLAPTTTVALLTVEAAAADGLRQNGSA